jgi:hypothetical protein
MGLYFGSRNTASQPADAPRPAGNPNPHRFEVVRSTAYTLSVVVEVLYPDCSNYEGRKILVFERRQHFTNHLTRGVLDPHFIEAKDSPIARFRPTEEGWELANDFAKRLLG